jgi:hypothetical protein
MLPEPILILVLKCMGLPIVMHDLSKEARIYGLGITVAYTVM